MEKQNFETGMILKALSGFYYVRCGEEIIIDEAATGDIVREKIASEDYDLVILDVMLPGIDGYQVCREVRAKSSIPIIMLSAKGEVFDKVLGLELGADDYIEKPFESKEMVARVKAVLRRYKTEDVVVKASNEECVNYPDLTVNKTNYSVTYMGKNIEMPPKELELLYFLAKSPNQVFSRDQLLDNVWGYEYYGDIRTVDVTVRRLREKIEDNPSVPAYIMFGIKMYLESVTNYENEFVGNIGDKIALEGLIDNIFFKDGLYGEAFIVTVNYKNRRVRFFSSVSTKISEKISQMRGGDKIKISGTVKSHNEYNNQKFTLLNRVSIL